MPESQPADVTRSEAPVEASVMKELAAELDFAKGRATALRIALEEIANNTAALTPYALAHLRHVAISAVLADDLAGGASA